MALENWICSKNKNSDKYEDMIFIQLTTKLSCCRNVSKQSFI